MVSITMVIRVSCQLYKVLKSEEKQSGDCSLPGRSASTNEPTCRVSYTGHKTCVLVSIFMFLRYGAYSELSVTLQGEIVDDQTDCLGRL
jgi:hypothetical protein